MGVYDVQQVCLNGHQITTAYRTDPQARRTFCDACGAKTIHECPECGAEIRGRYDADIFVTGADVPAHCDECGETFPWTTSRREKKADPPLAPQSAGPSKRVFVVHGRDEEAKLRVARFLERLGLEAVILHEQANAGRTLIEKFEAFSNVGFAVIILTPDDVGAVREKADELEPRARQNVILELGFFLGKLGRERVCALKKGDVVTPSDYDGVVYQPMDAADGWQALLARELRAANINIEV